MKTKVKYDVIYYNGDKGKLTLTHDVPDFEYRKHDNSQFKEFIINECDKLGTTADKIGLTFDTTIEEQVDEWLTEFDKSSLMDENDISIIINWEIVSIKQEMKDQVTNKLTVVEIKEKPLTQEQLVILYAHSKEMSILKNDFLAVYSEIKGSIKKMKFEKQCDIVYKSLGVAQKASMNTLEQLSSYKKALELVDWEKYKDIKGEYDMTSIHLKAKSIQNNTTNNLIDNE